jgi:hypothetical protein
MDSILIPIIPVAISCTGKACYKLKVAIYNIECMGKQKWVDLALGIK